MKIEITNGAAMSKALNRLSATLAKRTSEAVLAEATREASKHAIRIGEQSLRYQISLANEQRINRGLPPLRLP